MNRVVFLFTVLFLGAALGEAMAQCTRGTRVTDIQAALDNQFVCAITTNGTDTWSEEHGPGNLLTEYARGPGHPVDPRKQVGTWTVVNNGSPDALVTYNYNGGSSFTWRLYQLGGTTYFFCRADGSEAIARATITPLPVNPSNPCPTRG